MNESYEYIITEYQDLVNKIANNFYNIDKEDLIQAGNQGLIEAFNNFDDTKDTSFKAYASKYIYGSMHNLIYKTSDLKITKDALKLKKEIIKTYQEISQKENRIPSMQEIALKLNVDPYLLNATLNSNQKAISLDGTYYEDKDLKDIIPEAQTISLEDRIFLKESINSLPEPEKSIIKYRYYKDLTQNEIAIELGLSQVKVSRYEKKGMQRLREYAKECA